MRLICCSYWPPWPCFVTQTCFPHFCLLKLPYPTTNCAYINTFIPIYCLHMAIMSTGGILSAIKNSMTARCLNRMSSQPSISTGNKIELRIDVGSRISMVEKKYHVTAWNRFYPVFITLIKKYERGRKTLQPLLVNATAFCSVLWICIEETTYNTHSLLWFSLALPILPICYNYSFNILHILVMQCYKVHKRNHWHSYQNGCQSYYNYHCIMINPPASVWTTQQVLLLYPHQSLQLPDLMHHQCLLHVLHTTYTFSSPSSSSYEISHADTSPEAGTHSYR